MKSRLNRKIEAAQRSLTVKMDSFLYSNSRKDRDRVIKKREELITYKKLKDEFFPESK